MKALVASLACGSVWTMHELEDAGYLVDDNRCQLCFKEPGTLEHRFVCEATYNVVVRATPPLYFIERLLSPYAQHLPT